jgi:hypothetical protein
VFDEALRQFQAFMDSGGGGMLALASFAFLVAVAVLTPPLAAVHELGHAIVALTCSREPVLVTIGRGPGWLRGRIGRLAFELSPLPSQTPGPRGLTQTAARLRPRQHIAFLLGGQLANFILAALLIGVGERMGGKLAWALDIVAAFSLLLAVGNLIPHAYGAHRSDGSRALDVVRVRRARSSGRGEFDAAWEKLRTLSSARDDRFRTQARLELIKAVGRLERIAHDPVETTFERLFAAAFAGWCWRHVEPRGMDPDDVVRKAFDQALGEGHDQAETIVRAAGARPGLMEARRLRGAVERDQGRPD